MGSAVYHRHLMDEVETKLHSCGIVLLISACYCLIGNSCACSCGEEIIPRAVVTTAIISNLAALVLLNWCGHSGSNPDEGIDVGSMKVLDIKVVTIVWSAILVHDCPWK